MPYSVINEKRIVGVNSSQAIGNVIHKNDQKDRKFEQKLGCSVFAEQIIWFYRFRGAFRYIKVNKQIADTPKFRWNSIVLFPKNCRVQFYGPTQNVPTLPKTRELENNRTASVFIHRVKTKRTCCN